MVPDGPDDGGEGGIRTPDGLPRTAFPMRRHRPLGDLSTRRAADGSGGGEGGIRTHGAHRTPLFESGTINHSDTSPAGESSRGVRSGREGGLAVQAARFGLADTGNDRHLVLESRVASKIQDRAGTAPLRVADGENEDLDPSLHQGTDAHRARLVGGEDGDLRQPVPLQLAGRGLEREEDGMGGGVMGLHALVVLTTDHGVVEDGHRTDGALPLVGASAGLGDGLGHEQLVVHRTPSLAEGIGWAAVS